jgi:thiamine pyrophosphate-dependent acetolactate synthase large subunit-like protein
MNSRIGSIRKILVENPEAFVILSNGLTSREAAHFIPSARCFYMLHGMGESLAVGVGFAKSKPHQAVVVIEGDYNALMGLASWSLMPCPNLKYYILDNGVSETTGGQTIPKLPFVPSWCNVVSVNHGKNETPNPPQPAEIWSKCQSWLSGCS